MKVSFVPELNIAKTIGYSNLMVNCVARVDSQSHPFNNILDTIQPSTLPAVVLHIDFLWISIINVDTYGFDGLSFDCYNLQSVFRK
jgi:hypothetical protein